MFCGNSVGDVGHVVGHEAGEIHTAVRQHIDMMLVPQALHRLGRNAEQRKHSALRANEIERTVARYLAELSGEERAHIGYPSSHGGKFLEPLSLQCRVRENVRGYCGPVV